MKVITEVSINVMGKKVKLSIIDNKLVIETKKGNLPVFSVSSKRVVFLDSEKKVGVDFSENGHLATALFNATQKGCALLSFESYKEYLKEKNEKIGSDFDVDKVVHAYKYA